MEPCDSPGPWQGKIGVGGVKPRTVPMTCNRPKGHKGHHAYSTSKSARLLEWTSRGAVFPADREKVVSQDGATYSL